MQFRKTVLFLPFLAIVGQGLPHHDSPGTTDAHSTHYKVTGSQEIQIGDEGSESTRNGRKNSHVKEDIDFDSKSPETKTLGSSFQKIFNPISPFFEKGKSLKEQCDIKRGTLVDGECYELVTETENYDDAIDVCQSRGGDLWTPDVFDPFLYQKLIKFFPQILGVDGEDLWIGATIKDEGIFDRNGRDISNSYLIGVSTDNFATTGECLTLEFPDGSFHVDDNNCNNNQEFVCEYPLESEKKITLTKIFPLRKGTFKETIW